MKLAEVLWALSTSISSASSTEGGRSKSTCTMGLLNELFTGENGVDEAVAAPSGTGLSIGGAAQLCRQCRLFDDGSFLIRDAEARHENALMRAASAEGDQG